MEQSVYNEAGLRTGLFFIMFQKWLVLKKFPFFGLFDPCGIQAFEYFAAAKEILNQKSQLKIL